MHTTEVDTRHAADSLMDTRDHQRSNYSNQMSANLLTRFDQHMATSFRPNLHKQENNKENRLFLDKYSRSNYRTNQKMTQSTLFTVTFYSYLPNFKVKPPLICAFIKSICRITS